MYFKTALLIVIAYLFFRCKSGSSEHQQSHQLATPAQKEQVSKKYGKIVSPLSNATYKRGDSIKINVKVDNKNLIVDSVSAFLGKNRLGSLKSKDRQSWENKFILNYPNVGTMNVRVNLFYKDKSREAHSTRIIVLSDIIPVSAKWEIVKIHPHSINHFTQGLVYDDGFLYEGTGQWGKSNLIKYNADNFEVVNRINLSNDLFGEGVAVFNEKIIQLTWKSNVGFIYNKNTFELLQKVYYQSQEGWGITYNNKEFIMSDGTNNLYFLDTEYFTEIKRIEVYDQNGPVHSLNELEYINGRVFSNILGKDIIIAIDPESGKVTHKLDFTNLLDQKDKHENIDVLNGIAYNNDAGFFYITGKNWPKLFEIKVKGF